MSIYATLWNLQFPRTGQARACRAVFAGAVEERRRKRFLAGLAEEFERVRADPAAWDEELRERAAWDATLDDGLD